MSPCVHTPGDASAWPDPLGVGMHAVIPILFVVAVEAARHAVGRIADITADKHMEGVRLTRWLLSPIPTFKLWRRMKLWELRSYEQVIKLEQDRLIYQARLQARFGRSWRRKAPVESLMPLRLARFGVPLAETAPAGLAAAGIELALLPPRTQVQTDERIDVEVGELELASPGSDQLVRWSLSKDPSGLPEADAGDARSDTDGPRRLPSPRAHRAKREPSHREFGADAEIEAADQAHERASGDLGHAGEDRQPAAGPWFSAWQDRPAVGELDDEQYYAAFCAYVAELGDYPSAHQFGLFLMDVHGVVGRSGGPLDEQSLGSLLPGLRHRYQQDLDVESAGLEPEEHAAPDSGEASKAVPAPRAAQEVEQQVPVPAEQPQPSPADASAPREPAPREPAPREPAPREPAPREPAPREPASHEAVQPTAVDRYYLGYESFLHTHGRDPNREELAAHLADHGITNPHGQPVKANAVGRYQLEFRTYAVWAEMCETTGTEPDLVALLEEVDARGIKGLHNKPLTAEWMAERVEDFRRRRRAIAPAIVDWSSVIG